MTKRQQRIAKIVSDNSAEVCRQAREQLDDKHVGISTMVRVGIRFVVASDAIRALTWGGEIRLLVTKTPDGFDYIEYDPIWQHRKGRRAPKPRPLPCGDMT